MNEPEAVAARRWIGKRIANGSVPVNAIEYDLGEWAFRAWHLNTGDDVADLLACYRAWLDDEGR